MPKNYRNASLAVTIVKNSLGLQKQYLSEESEQNSCDKWNKKDNNI